MDFFIPRFQGNAIQDDKGWYWELFVSQFGGGQEAKVFTTTNRFKTKDEALKNLHEAIQMSIDDLHKKHPEIGIDPDRMIDLKNNQTLKRNEVLN